MSGWLLAVLVASLAAPRGGGVVPHSYFAALDTVLFFAGDRAHEWGLWRSDGTDAGTYLVHDTVPNLLGSGELNGLLYFGAGDGLWRTDGSGEGTELVRSFQNPSEPSAGVAELTATGERLFFSGSDAEYGRELWTSDGTPEGTVMVTDINPGAASSYPSALAAFEGKVFFRATRGNANELWQSDGTATGTTFVHELGSGLVPLIATAGGLVYFTVYERGVAPLWRTDGSPSGTFALHDFLAEVYHLPVSVDVYGPSSLVDIGGLAVFAAKDERGWELWRTDGTPGGTILVRDIGPESAGIYVVLGGGGLAYFSADDGVHGRELWRSDGTEEGTVLVKDISPGAASSDPSYFGYAGGLIYFEADDRVHGREPWRSDGTESGTLLLRDITLGASNSRTFPFFATDGLTFFGAATDQFDFSSRRLWKTDGSESGTVPVQDFTLGPPGPRQTRVVPSRP